MMAFYESSYMPRMTLELTQSGVNQVNAIFKALGEKLGRREVKKVFRMGAKPIVVSAKAKVPVSGKKSWQTEHKHWSKGKETKLVRTHKPGELKRSIGTIMSKDGFSIYIGPRMGTSRANDGWYGHFVEFGTSSTGWGKGIPAKPFMRPAWDEKKNEAIDIIARELGKLFESVRVK